MKDYILVIHSPFDVFEALNVLRSETPFMAIHIGDAIDPESFDFHSREPIKSLLRVTDVQHLISLTDDLNRAKHQIDIFTTIDAEAVVVSRITRAASKDEAGDETKKKLAQLLGVSPDELPDSPDDAEL